MDIIRQFNWIDIFIVILLMRIGYVAIKNGLPLELFKLLGTVFSVYVSLHYYSGLAAFLKERTIKSAPLEFLTPFSLVALAILGYFIFIVLRKVFYWLIALEPVQKLNQWGGFVLGMFRAVLAISLFMFILVVSPVTYLKNSVGDAYLGKRIFKVAPATYSLLWNNFASKFMAKEAFNKNIVDIQPSLGPSQK